MKKINLILLAIFLLAAAGFLIQRYNGSPSVKVYEFTGSVRKVDGQTLYMHGNYSALGHPEFRDENQAFDVKVKIGSNTKLIRITIHRPANFAAQIAAGKAVNPKTLKQEVGAGSLQDFAGGKVNGATIEASSNIYRDKKFLAQSITYYYAVDEK